MSLATCPDCGRSVLVNQDGRLRVHRAEDATGVRCANSVRPKRQPRVRKPPDPDKRYGLDLCGHCHHPGGCHMIGRMVDGEWVDLHGACKCGECPGWDKAHVYRGYWTDRQSRELEATWEASVDA